MIELPRALEPWAPQLELFPEELALALGGVVAKLAQLVGGFSSGRAPEGEPDGYDGITQRGPYERLLPSQWLLLDELPDEFLRRVVAGEHAFLRRAHAGRAAQRRCVALFDAGVGQLGSPRIGQLALWLVLAQRAQLAGATFEWGTLQDAELALHPVQSASSMRQLLAARTHERVSAEQLAAQLAAHHGPATSELWLVGEPALAGALARLGTPAAQRTAVIAFSDVLEPGAPRVAVRAELPWRGRPAELSLELPEERLTARLLRDPFAAAGGGRVVSTAHLDPGSTPVFSPDGRRLYVLTRSGSLVSVTVQSSLNAPPVRPSVFHPPAGQSIFAVTRYEKRTVVLALTDESAGGPLVVAHMLSKRGASATGSYGFAPVDGYVPQLVAGRSRLRPIGAFSSDHFGFVDDHGDVVDLVAGKLKLGLAADAFAVTAVRGRLVWASLAAGGKPWVRWAAGAGPYLTALEINDSTASSEQLALAVEGRPVRELYFGRPFSELVAMSTGLGQWTLVGRRTEHLRVAAELEVMGVIEHLREARAALLVLDATRTRLDSISSSGKVSLLTTAAPISAVAVSTTGHEVAFLTTTGELGVYSTDRERRVLSMTKEVT